VERLEVYSFTEFVLVEVCEKADISGKLILWSEIIILSSEKIN